jgi:hypothetical protein
MNAIIPRDGKHALEPVDITLPRDAGTSITRSVMSTGLRWARDGYLARGADLNDGHEVGA